MNQSENWEDDLLTEKYHAKVKEQEKDVGKEKN